MEAETTIAEVEAQEVGVLASKVDWIAACRHIGRHRSTLVPGPEVFFMIKHRWHVALRPWWSPPEGLDH
jgi:hypothetical protein